VAAMLLVSSNSRYAARKMSWLMFFVLLGGLAFTMRFYVKPKPEPRGFRVFGFPRPKAQSR
jgi:hypothetical protein